MANVKISALPAATTVAASDLLPVVQGGVTKQVTPDLLPLSAAAATALAAKAGLASPAFTGSPTIDGTTVAKTSDITAAITALVGSAPAALDTLQEIDAQLTTDEGSAAALAALVAGKAAALTAQATRTVSATLTADTVNPFDATTGPLTATLPTPGKTGQVITVEKTDTTANLVTIAGTLRGAATSMSISTQYESIVLVAESLTSWRPVAGHRTKTAIDTAIAGQVTAQATTDAATYAPLALARPGNRWVSLGDSITAGSFDVANYAWSESWVLYAMLASQARLRLVYNAGVAGNTSAAMLARFDTDVTPYSPRIVTLLAGTNDIGTSVPFATFKTNIAAIVAKIRALGAAPVLATIPPRDAGGYGPTIVLWNAWIRDYAERNGLTVLDFHRQLTDPSNGHYLAAYYNDGIHPNPAGHAALGDITAWALAPLTPNNGPLLPVDSTDTNNLLGAPGLFLTNSSGVGTGWAAGSAPTGVTKTITTDAGIVGNYQTITMTAASGPWVQTANIATGFAVGDLIRIVGVVSSDGGTGVAPQVRLSFTGGGVGMTPIASVSQPFTRGVFSIARTVVAGTTALQVQLQAGAAGASGVVSFAQIGVYNLTQMGLAA